MQLEGSGEIANKMCGSNFRHSGVNPSAGTVNTFRIRNGHEIDRGGEGIQDLI
jgi:hypothetical protein